MKTNQDTSEIDNFEEKRLIGENDSYICSLIRQDLIEDFIVYVNKTNLPLSSQIQPSIFETNYFLIDKKPTLIEYAAFFGSIQIFQYLQANKIKLDSSLWLYSIHGKNDEIILNLVDNKIEPSDDSYEECLEESIKCHHNDIAEYIYDNLLNKQIEENNLSFENHVKRDKTEFNYNKNILSYSFHYYNFKFIPIDLNNQFIIYYLVEYDYYTLVKLLLKTKKIDLNLRIDCKYRI